MPVAVTLKLALVPVTPVWLEGWVVIAGGTRTVSFRVEERGRERRKVRSDRKAAPNAAELDPVALALWEVLRAWRLEEARRQELPPYVIFHDSTLTEVARRRPVSLAALAEILDQDDAAAQEFQAWRNERPSLVRKLFRTGPGSPNP